MHSSGRSTGVNVGKSSSSNLNGGGGGNGDLNGLASSMPSPSATILDTLKKKMNMLKDELEVSKDELERTRQQLEEEKRRRECVSPASASRSVSSFFLRLYLSSWPLSLSLIRPGPPHEPNDQMTAPLSHSKRPAHPFLSSISG